MLSKSGNFASVINMSKYNVYVDETPEGLKKLDESTQNATIDRLIAAIQCNKLSAEKVMDLTQHFRERQSIEDKELYRLGFYSVDYNKKWATNNNGCFGREKVILSKRQSQYKSWREMLLATSRRYKKTPRDEEEPQDIYNASFLTHQPYEMDIWGPPSYGRLVYDLWDTIDTTIKHMEDGRQLCDKMIEDENAINQDPQWKEALFWEQYYKESEKSNDTIEFLAKNGIVDTENSEYKRMLTYPDMEKGYAINNFHRPSESNFSGFVITNETLALRNNNITSIENRLLGRDISKILHIRFLIDHLPELLSLKGQRFDKIDTMCFIKWCNVRKESSKRKDNEHLFFDYIRSRYHGDYRFYGWPSLFEVRKLVFATEDSCKLPVAALNKKAIELWNSYNKEPWE